MLHRSTAILLALLVLVSSTGYSITAHLCHGKAVSYSLFGRPADCGPAEEMAAEEHCDHPEISNSAETTCKTQECCTDESRFFKGIETAVPMAKQVCGVSDFLVTAQAARIVFGPAIFTSSVKPPLGGYHPPEYSRDLPVLLRVFRI